MGKRKNSEVELVTWNQTMDDALLDALEYQSNSGNQINGTFTSKAYDNILKELSGKFKDVAFDKEKIKNRVKYLKRNFGSCYDLFKGLSGFSWNPVSNMWGAEPGVWQDLFKSRPEAKVWMTKPVRNYKKLEALFGDDRATEEDAETAAEIRERNARLNDVESGVQVDETIEEVDFLVSQNQATLGGYDVDPESPLLNKSSGEENTSKQKQKIKRSKYVEAVNLNESFKTFANAIKESTVEMMKTPQRLPIPESEIWTYLEELQLEDEMVEDAAYLYLTKEPDRLAAFLGCPSHRRKTILLKMLHDAAVI
ncbi:Myb/SANT-like DNA-binding domain protein [Rhynchospora pubera]|uniref:Myb/SANT-like DNA-binding domain protein n=1 Tax=Rhynchospora pubera TaxID=906938 RepID=A0AAV8DTG1_9POAL|nr:Myb/SANT-like DNA-binding domain protein [Rhynchospora pubera]